MTTRKPKTRYHHGDLRDALLNAACELLREGGIHGLSLRECARRAGVSHAAPYRHFPTKDALLSAISGQGFRWLRAAGAEAMAGLTDPRARLDAYGVAYVQFAVEHPEHHRVMFTGEFETLPEDTEAADEAFGLHRECAVDLVDPDEDPDAAAASFWSLPHGLSMLIIDGRVPAEHVATLDAVEALARQAFSTWRRY